jgi:hypothetical protein
MPKDTATKFREALEAAEAYLTAEAQSAPGVDPMMVLVAGVLPMVKAAISDAARDPERFERTVDGAIAFLLALRGDDRPGLLAVPDAGGPVVRYIRAVDGLFDGGDTLGLAVAVDAAALSVPGVPDGLHGLR